MRLCLFVYVLQTHSDLHILLGEEGGADSKFLEIEQPHLDRHSRVLSLIVQFPNGSLISC